MVMAASEASRLRKERPTKCIELFGEHDQDELGLILLFEFCTPECQEGRHGPHPTAVVEIFGADQATSDLFVNELIKPQIRVEAIDDVVAIMPGLLRTKAPVDKSKEIDSSVAAVFWTNSEQMSQFRSVIACSTLLAR